ncbi:Peptidase S26 domain-containing protein [Plasmodiophora brassicae]|uniref:Peptidase S26 domain-containing protein n=1 Tax=Plasmodiophora brassicae TaxID=37360 RepID=A0A0G4IS69_PLABS|nr:hypothetical protein PBRA_006166 [Plasmodiophora brassicae]SPQ96127.1 unnamed protein product [Plasmodiophora brassicae]
MQRAGRWLWGGLAAAVVVPEFIGSVRIVKDDSMYPDLHRGDFVLLDRFSVRVCRAIPRNSVFSYRSPQNPGEQAISRVIGLTNDWIVRDGNSRALVPEGNVWLENSNSSSTTGHCGALPAALVDARVTWIVWPPARFGPVGHSHDTGRLRTSIWDP